MLNRKRTYKLFQGDRLYDEFEFLEEALSVGDQLASGDDQIYSVLSHDGVALASMTQRRIIGVFMRWGQGASGTLVRLESLPFDATDCVLALSLGELHGLMDNDTSSTRLGLMSLRWEGPVSVILVDRICQNFGVEELREITQTHLEFVRERLARLNRFASGRTSSVGIRGEADQDLRPSRSFTLFDAEA